MSLYRAKPGDGVVWITGASAGIGRALTQNLARQGYDIAATARDQGRLDALIADMAGLPGRVVAFACDVADEAAMADTAAAIEKDIGPIALAIFNAGNFLPTRGRKLDVRNFVDTFRINVLGVVFGLVPTVARMHERGRGHIVLVGSVSGYFGLPSAASYGASKAALNNMAEALKHDLDSMNIRIQVVNPGFVDTPLTKKNTFPMPALMQAEEAAKRIASAIATGGFEASFPRRLTWPMKLLRILPMPLRYWIIHRVTGWGQRPPKSPDPT